MTVTLKSENWFFCETCNTLAYRMDCCGNTSCNGGGCQECKDINAEAWAQIANGTAPAKESVPFRSRISMEDAT